VGDSAYQIGLVVPRHVEPFAPWAAARFLAVWRRVPAGEWKMERALWTPSAPMPSAGGTASQCALAIIRCRQTHRHAIRPALFVALVLAAPAAPMSST
jgi:hypothetical protein